MGYTKTGLQTFNRDVDLQQYRVINSGAPVDADDLATKEYVDFKTALSVKAYGATGDGVTDDTAAIEAAIAALSASGGTTLFFPEGRYRLSSTITLSDQMRIIGEGSAILSASRGSQIQFTGDDMPIVVLPESAVTGSNAAGAAVIRDISLAYVTLQTSAQTNSACIWLSNGSRGLEVTNVSLLRGAYGIFQPASTDSWNNQFDYIYINGFSISAIDLQGSGTNCEFGHIYIQNLSPQAASSTASITNVSHVGAEITFTVDAVPPLLFENMFIHVSNMDSAYNGLYVVKTISGTDIIVDDTADPGDPVITSGGSLWLPGQAAVGPIVGSNYGYCVFRDLQIEHCVISTTTAFWARGERVAATSIKFEQVYSSADNFRYIALYKGGLDALSVAVYNCGIKPGYTGYIFYTVDGFTATSAFIGSTCYRDLAYAGATLTLAGRQTSTYPDIILRNERTATTARVNAVSVTSGPGSARFLFGQKKTMVGSSGTDYGCEYEVEANQSGTAGYSALKINVVPTAEGSGTKQLLSCAYNDDVRFDVRPTGIFIDSPSGVGSSQFGYGTGSTAFVNISYGGAVDRGMYISGNTIDVKNGAGTGQSIQINRTSAKDVILGALNPATNITSGFLVIPGCNGAPSGTPSAAASGSVPLIYDYANNQLYAYNGGWKKTAALT